RHVPPQRPARRVAVQMEGDGPTDDQEEIEIGPGDVAPVGEVIGLAQFLEFFLEVGVLEGLVRGRCQANAHGTYSRCRAMRISCLFYGRREKEGRAMLSFPRITHRRGRHARTLSSYTNNQSLGPAIEPASPSERRTFLDARNRSNLYSIGFTSTSPRLRVWPGSTVSGPAALPLGRRRYVPFMIPRVYSRPGASPSMRNLPSLPTVMRLRFGKEPARAGSCLEKPGRNR